MAHRRAAAPTRAWARWLTVPVALTLDAVAAVHLAGKPLVTGVVVPEGVLLAAPVLVYGALAVLAFRTRPLGTRLAAAAVLLGIHGGLVAVHAVGYIALWSLPAPAAIRLAHRWSPLIPLLQLVWVPLLASPLVSLTRLRPSPASRRTVSTPGRRDVLASRGTHAGSRARVQPGREVHLDLGRPGPARELPPTATASAPSAAVVEAPPAVEPESVPITLAIPTAPAAGGPAASPAVSPAISPTVSPAGSSAISPTVSPTLSPTVSPTVLPTVLPTLLEVVEEEGAVPPLAPAADGERRAIAPAPVWFDELAEAFPRAVAPALPGAEVADHRAAGDDLAPLPPAPPVPPVPPVVETVALALIPPATPVAVEPIAALPVSTGDTRADELPAPTDVAPVVQPSVPAAPAAHAPLPLCAMRPPVDPYLVARLFEPYGPLLSRDRTVLVDWTPGPGAAVLCAAPRGAFRDEAVRLGARLGHALDTGSAPVRRLSLRGPDGVVVLTPLDGAVLVAAARRPGALALLEVLSARVVPGPIRGKADAAREDATPALEVLVSGATRVATPAAIIDVLAPDGVPAAATGELAGRLLATVAAAEGPALDTLSVDLGSHRLMVHPVHPNARPPRFVAVVGAPDRPGLLGRRTERAARALREAS